jgi:hypothetical protein
VNMRMWRCLNIAVLGIALLLPAEAYAELPVVDAPPVAVEIPAIQSAPSVATTPVETPSVEVQSQPGFIDSSRDYVAD